MPTPIEINALLSGSSFFLDSGVAKNSTGSSLPISRALATTSFLDLSLRYFVMNIINKIITAVMNGDITANSPIVSSMILCF